MKYAVIDNTVVTNIILLDDVTQFSTESALVELTEESDVGMGYAYNEGVFTAPPPIVVKLSPEEQVAMANSQKTQFMAVAAESISVLQDAADLDMATDEETQQLAAWKKYRVLVSRIDTSTALNIQWPSQPMKVA